MRFNAYDCLIVFHFAEEIALNLIAPGGPIIGLGTSEKFRTRTKADLFDQFAEDLRLGAAPASLGDSASSAGSCR